MRINLTLDGTPDQLRDFLTAGLTMTDAEGCDLAEHEPRAAQILESAVKAGGALIELSTYAHEGHAIHSPVEVTGTVQ